MSISDRVGRGLNIIDQVAKQLPFEPERSLHAVRVKAAMGLGPYLVILASTFNLGLCFLQTHFVSGIGTTVVIVCELTIMALALFTIRHHLSPHAVRVAGCVLAVGIGLKFLNSGVDIKILHDIAIPFLFYKCGTLVTVETGNRVMWIVMTLALIFGFFEFLLPTIYTQTFDIWTYYVNKGTLSASITDYTQSGFNINGTRAFPRTLLPGLLGPHRVASIFLEPVSMGNFGVIAFAWSLSNQTGAPRWRLMLCAVICIILADSRTGIGACFVFSAVRLLPPLRSNLLIFLIPIFTLIMLTTAGSLGELPFIRPGIASDDLSGRLLFSGRLLDYWSWHQWFGLMASPIYTLDTGYAYVISNIGLPVSIFLLLVFAFHPVTNSQAQTMKAMTSAYLAMLLCIGAAVFSIKTAAVIWFLYGSANSALTEVYAAPLKRATQRARQHFAVPRSQQSATSRNLASIVPSVNSRGRQLRGDG